MVSVRRLGEEEESKELVEGQRGRCEVVKSEDEASDQDELERLRALGGSHRSMHRAKETREAMVVLASSLALCSTIAPNAAACPTTTPVKRHPLH